MILGCSRMPGTKTQKAPSRGESHLRSYRKKMDKAIYEQTVQNFISRRLREMNAIPRMSLFYL
jgi:hypothetical protein